MQLFLEDRKTAKNSFITSIDDGSLSSIAKVFKIHCGRSKEPQIAKPTV